MQPGALTHHDLLHLSVTLSFLCYITTNTLGFLLATKLILTIYPAGFLITRWAFFLGSNLHSISFLFRTSRVFAGLACIYCISNSGERFVYTLVDC
jgi:hypothetical protein